MMSFHEILTTLTHEQTHIDIRTHADFNCIAHNFFAITYSILFVRAERVWWQAAQRPIKCQFQSTSNRCEWLCMQATFIVNVWRLILIHLGYTSQFPQNQLWPNCARKIGYIYRIILYPFCYPAAFLPLRPCIYHMYILRYIIFICSVVVSGCSLGLYCMCAAVAAIFYFFLSRLIFATRMQLPSNKIVCVL